MSYIRIVLPPPRKLPGKWGVVVHPMLEEASLTLVDDDGSEKAIPGVVSCEISMKSNDIPTVKLTCVGVALDVSGFLDQAQIENTPKG